jgi:hypothetical protein
MKSFLSELHRSDPMYSAATSTSPPSARRGDETARLVVIEDDRVFQEFEVEIRCDLEVASLPVGIQ